MPMYNTGNPPGSTAPKDLSDNAQTLDNLITGTEPAYVNRLTVFLRSWAGMTHDFDIAQAGRTAEFQETLAATGFVDIGNYAAGVTLTARNQVFVRSGTFYSAAPALALPYTLTGDWATESSNFLIRSDAVLRQDLAAANGDAMVSGTNPAAGALKRSVASRFAESAHILDFTTANTGVTSVVAALTTANAANLPGLTFSAGRYLVDASITLNMPVRMDPGARFVIPTGVTLTISDSFESGVGYRFECTGTGKVVFGKNSLAEGYPEWWGATTNLMTDASAAVTAALLAVPGVVQCQAADYYAATSFKHPVAGKTLRGTGSHWFNKPADSTRLISMSGSAHVLILGPDTQPATINDFPQGIKVENLLATRSVAPVIASACVGVLSRWTLFQTMDDVKSAESMHGFQYQGTVQARTDNAHSFRSIAGTGAGTDYFRAFFIDGTTVLSGVAGGNASVHWDRCVAGCVLAGVNSYGMYVNGAWADTFIQNFEASVCTVGVYCQGDAQTTLNYKTVDLHIINPVIDQFSFAGIFIDGTSPFGTISIVGGYVAPVGTGTPTAGVYVKDSKGNVNISGGFQYICGPNATMTAGLLVVNSRNVDSIGNVIAECSTVGVLLQGSTNCRIMDRTMNYSRAGVAGCQMSLASNRNYVAMMSSGGSGGLQYGVQMLADTNNYNEINATGLDPAVVGVTKIQRNGAAVVATGLSGTNLISGVIA